MRLSALRRQGCVVAEALTEKTAAISIVGAAVVTAQAVIPALFEPTALASLRAIAVMRGLGLAFEISGLTHFEAVMASTAAAAKAVLPTTTELKSSITTQGQPKITHFRNKISR